MTVGVYGLVGGIVKLDDAGLYLSRLEGHGAFRSFQRSLGRGTLLAAHWLMKGLSVAGTIAMFLVGGGILVHGIQPLGQAIEGWSQCAATVAGIGLVLGPMLQLLLPFLIDAVVGLAAGALALLVVTLGKRVWSRGLG